MLLDQLPQAREPAPEFFQFRRLFLPQEADILDLPTTVIILILAAVAVGWAYWRSRRPYMPGRPPLIPYGVVQFVGMVVVFLMVAHLITLLTGKPFTGRRGY